MKKKLAIFDFDGTITAKDSFLTFLLYSLSPFKFIYGILILWPVLLLYKLRVLDNGKAKEIVFRFFFKGWKEKEFDTLARNFAEKEVPRLVRMKALEEIQMHLRKGHQVVVVTASIENWVKPWADMLNISLIGTKIEILNGKITGKLLGKNCYGEEKVIRLQEYLDLSDFSYIYGYGDSRGDKEILGVVQEKYWKPFRNS